MPLGCHCMHFDTFKDRAPRCAFDTFKDWRPQPASKFARRTLRILTAGHPGPSIYKDRGRVGHRRRSQGSLSAHQGSCTGGLGLRNNRSRTTDLTYIARYDPFFVDFCHFPYKISVYSSDGTGTPTAASLLKSGVSDTPTHRLNCREELDVIPELNHINDRRFSAPHHTPPLRIFGIVVKNLCLSSD